MMARAQQNNDNPSIKITRSEDIDLPVFEPGGYKGIRVREWANLRKAVSRLSGMNSKWETTFNIAATSFFTFIIPALTTSGDLNGWKAFFTAASILSFGVATTSFIAWRTEKSRNQAESKDVLELMDEIDSFYPQVENDSNMESGGVTSSAAEVKAQSLIKNNTEDDELFQEALRIAHEAGKVSTSMLQRRLRIGYGRAARIVDEMERKGIVGESDGSRPRAVISKGE